MPRLYVQVGLLSLPNHYYEFKEVVVRALEELGGILREEAIVTRVLTIPLGVGNSTGDFAALLTSINRGDGSTEAFTITPRKPRQYAGAPSEVDYEQPLVVVIETPTSMQFTKAFLLHEFGHAKEDYPTIWELLETTSIYPVVRQIEAEQLLWIGWNPFCNTHNADPFREYVAQTLAIRYVPEDAKAIEARQLADLRGKADEGLHKNNFFLHLFLRIVGELSGTTFPGVEGDSASSAIVQSICRNDFQGYARQTITEILGNRASPLASLRVHLEQVLKEVNRTLRDFE
jgi:hypothetical protein